MAGLVLWNVEAGRPEMVPADQVQSALSSGKYLQGAPDVTEGAAGIPIARDASTIGAADVQGEHDTALPEAQGVTEREQQRRAYVDTGSDAALTFAEGVVDAVSLGFLHETGETADLRREVNSGESFAGELVGTAVGLKLPGPMKFLAETGEAAGTKAAKLFLGEVAPGSRAAIAVKAAGGATEMAGLMGAASVGHQITDAVLDDKEFSGYSVMEEAGLGLVLGGGMKFLEGTFGRAASRYDVSSQGGLLDPTSAEAQNVAKGIEDAKTAWDATLEAHESRLGALNQLGKDGVLDQYINQTPEFMEQRGAAAKAARAAKARLEAVSFEGAVDEDPKKWSKWLNAVEDYQHHVGALDELMSPKLLEQVQRVVPGEPMAPGVPGSISEVVQLPDSDIKQMNELMKGNPDLQAQYERIYGHPFEEVRRPGAGIEGEQNLGGQETATSREGTPVQSGRGRAPVTEGQKLTSLFSTATNAASDGFVDSMWKRVQEGTEIPRMGPLENTLRDLQKAGRLTSREEVAKVVSEYGRPAEASTPQGLQSRFDVSDVDAEMAPAQDVQRPTPSEPDRPWAPSSPAGRFNPAEFTPTTLAGEGAGGKFISPTEGAQSADNVLSRAHPDLARTQYQFRNGFFSPENGSSDMLQNARAFSDFMERMKDTPGRIAPEASAVETKTPVLGRQPAAPELGPTPVIPRETAPAPTVEGRPTPVMPRPDLEQGPAAGQGRLKASLKQGGRDEAKQAVRNYIDQWYTDSRAQGPRLSPGDQAAARIRRVLDDINSTGKGRTVSSGSTDLSKMLGLPVPRSALGATLNDLYTMRRVAELSADASKGTVMNGVRKNKTMDWLVRRAGGKVGASVAGGMVGHAVGGPLGYFLGSALATKYAGFAGRAAGIAGRTYQSCLKAAASLLKGSRSTVIARAIAGNRPYAYSDNGPIQDPIERIQEIRRVASGQAVPQAVVQSAGDMSVVHPELVQNMVQAAMLKVQYLASVAPQIRYDRLGNPLPLTAGEQRKFFEAENATHDLQSILLSISNGSVTSIQVDALQKAHTPAYHKIAAFLIQDPEVMATLSREKLKVAEMVLGAQLTPGSDPMFVMRQQSNWTPPQQEQSGPAQALKIPGAGGPPSAGRRPINPNREPSAAGLPSQSSSGRAPGN